MLAAWKVLSTAGAMAVLAGSASAQTFSAGIPPGWTCVGSWFSCGALGANGDVTLSPTGASQYGFVTTRGGTYSGGIAGVSGSGAGGHATNGTVLRSPWFFARANTPLGFYFNYVTSDGWGFEDYAWARLLTPTLFPVEMIFTARTMTNGQAVPGQGMPPIGGTTVPSTVPIIPGAPVWSPLGEWSNTCFIGSGGGCGYTGWVFSQFVIGASGRYVLEFGVTNWNDDDWDSGLAIDGLTLNGQPIQGSIEPEPVTMVLFGTGMAGLAALRAASRRRRRST